jgi:alanyl-tRNA synthetase
MATEKLYWADPFATTFEATAQAAELAGRRTLVLDRTLFYPESGGQLADAGEIVLAGRTLRVADVQVDDDGRIHHVFGDTGGGDGGSDDGGDGALASPGPVRGTIDRERRRDHMAQHTGQHALSRALVDVARAETVSSRLGATSCTIDVEGALDDRLVARAEDLVNALVRDDVTVRQLFPTADELRALPLRRAPKVDRIHDPRIRVIDIEGFDMSPCGGTHCTRTGQIGALRVVGLERYKGGWRVTFHAGQRALDDARRKEAVLAELAREFTCGLLDVGAAVGKLRAELKARTDALSGTRGELVTLLAEKILEAYPPAPGGGERRVVVVREQDDVGMLRTLAGRLAARGDVVAICAAPAEPRDDAPDAPRDWSIVVQRGAGASFDCGAWLKAAAAKTGGRGGGRPERAEGRLPRAASIEDLAR